MNNARSCVSVSRMSAVISCCCRSAFVNIFGGGNLGAFRCDHLCFATSTYDSSAMDCAQSEICSRCVSRRVIPAV